MKRTYTIDGDNYDQLLRLIASVQSQLEAIQIRIGAVATLTETGTLEELFKTPNENVYTIQITRDGLTQPREWHYSDADIADQAWKEAVANFDTDKECRGLRYFAKSGTLLEARFK